MDSQVEAVAVVTGSSKGIGAAVARRLARLGHVVYVTYCSDRAAGEAVAADIRAAGGSAHLAQLDVADADSVRSLFAEVTSRYGRLDVLVSNAAAELSRPLEQQTLADWQRVLAVKLDGIFLCTQAALPLFRASGDASLIAISSFEGERPSPDHVAYGVAAAGVNAFVKAMAQYLPAHGARCTAICPGAVRTPLWSGGRQADEAWWTELAAANPMSRNATPEDVADAVATIVGEPTRYLNGNFLYVNGGNHLRG